MNSLLRPPSAHLWSRVGSADCWRIRTIPGTHWLGKRRISASLWGSLFSSAETLGSDQSRPWRVQDHTCEFIIGVFKQVSFCSEGASPAGAQSFPVRALLTALSGRPEFHGTEAFSQIQTAYKPS